MTIPTPPAMVAYPTILLVIIILAFILSHYRAFTRTNPDMRIQQTEHPDNDTIYTLISNRLPTLFLYDVELWDGFDLMIGYPYEDIKTVLKDNRELIRQLKKLYLAPFSAPLTRDWSVELKRNGQMWSDISTTQQATHETCYGGHYIAALSGLLCVCLINPSTTNKIWLEQNHYSYLKSDSIEPKQRTAKYFIDHPTDTETPTNTDNDDTPKKSKHIAYDKSGKIHHNLSDIEYITIPVRPSHVLYIPYDWHYYLYCGQEGSYACYLDLKNQTWI